VPDAVDRFYGQAENIPILILSAFKIVQMKATGVPQSEIEKDLTLNRQAVNLPAKPPKAKYSARGETGNDQSHRLTYYPRPAATLARVLIRRGVTSRAPVTQLLRGQETGIQA
jgi:hypothetical protein